jgi:SAM-dependent methyltransferase
MKCRICGNTENMRVFNVQEMMFGYKDHFLYFQCSVCDCLQIYELPEDISKYYPSNYYSFKQNISDQPKQQIQMMAKQFYTYYLARLGITRTSRILDVGCGSGSLLYALRQAGLKNVLGVDPFIQDHIFCDGEMLVVKGNLQDIDQKWDVIMLHHSLEHIYEQFETMRTITGMLSDHGTCLIRIPIASSYAWEHYGVNWVQIDAPRHYFIHSVKSLEVLAGSVGLQVADVLYDSTDFQFWASEQYIHDIPLFSERSFAVNPTGSIFSQEQIHHFHNQALQLNAARQGDQAAFYLSKKS